MSLAGAAQCTDCPKNTYQNVKTQATCINCPAGHWTNGLTRRTSLDDCQRMDTFEALIV